MNNKNEKIILSLAVISLTIAGGTAATIAYFSDTGSITRNTFSTGTLDLKIDNDLSPNTYNWVNNFASPISFTNLKPGTVDSFKIDIANMGTVDGNATIDLNRTSTWNDLAGVLKFHIYYDSDNNGSFVDTGISGTVDAFTGPITLGPIEGPGLSGANKMATVKVEWSIPFSVGNEIQGQSVTIDGVFGLVQTP